MEVRIEPKNSTLAASIRACMENGDKILEDVEFFRDYERENYSTMYFFCIISQEEFAKAFLLYLIKEKIVPWTNETHRSLQDHKSKQLVCLVMDFLSPPFDELIEWNKNKEYEEGKWGPLFPPHVIDAINIYRHEKIGRWESKNWVWDKIPNYNPTAKKIGSGYLDRRKQDALYVKVGKNGKIANIPSDVTKEMFEDVYERASNHKYLIKSLIESDAEDMKLNHLKGIIKMIFSENKYLSREFCLNYVLK